MESLKQLSELTEPDIRNLYFVVTDEASWARRLTLEDIHKEVSAIVLSESVPADIRSHFAQAQNLATYSWFHYPFNVTAQFMGFISVELALKQRFGKRDSFKNLIRKAVEGGLIQDEGFAISRHREVSSRRYVETLIEVMPDLRNELAHGSSMLHNNSVASLRICADFINQLFHPKPEDVAENGKKQVR